MAALERHVGGVERRCFDGNLDSRAAFLRPAAVFLAVPFFAVPLFFLAGAFLAGLSVAFAAAFFLAAFGAGAAFAARPRADFFFGGPRAARSARMPSAIS